MSCSPGVYGGTSDPPVHDLVVKHIASYLLGDTCTLHNMILVSKQFHALRLDFIKLMFISEYRANRVLKDRPPGWNYVHTLSINFCLGSRVSTSGLEWMFSFISSTNNDMDFLGNINNLILFHFEKVVIKKPLEKLHLWYYHNNTLELHHTVKYVQLHQCDMKEMSHFRHLHTLELFSCENIIDLSPLTELHTIIMSNCKGIKDISPLKKAHCVKLADCHHIYDISPLANIHTCRIAYCCQIRDVSVLSKLHTLMLESLSITDVSDLGHVHSLSIRHCHLITDFSALGTVNTLELMAVSCIQNVEPLATVDDLFFWGCHGIKDISPLSRVETLTLKRCDNIRDISVLEKVKNLTIIECRPWKDVGFPLPRFRDW